MNKKPIAMGYARKDGGKGIRNKVLLINTTSCADEVSRRITEHYHQLGFPVDYMGCECCENDEDLYRSDLCYVNHQNVGAVLAVGMGCEPFPTAKLAEAAREAGKPGAVLFIRDAGGTEKAVEEGIRIVDGMLEELKHTPRVPVYLSDLSFGAECGGSDFTSGLAANPLVGRFYDRVVKAGGTAMFEEIYEAVGLRDYLLSRCANEHARQQMAETYDRMFAGAKAAGQFSISPGNMRGGLTSVEEKSMGATAKSGTMPIEGVITAGHKPPHKGLWCMFGPTYFRCFGTGGDATAGTTFGSCGAHITFLTSGRGHITNNVLSVLVKITGNARTYQTLQDDVDVNASVVLTGEKTLDELEEDLYGLVCRIADGELTKGERSGHYEW